jgi:ribosomal protein S27E
MSIRFKCPHCQKPLAVKDHLAGKKAACPVCKKAIIIPAPVTAAPATPAAAPEMPAADVEDLAAAALNDAPAETKPPEDEAKTVDFNCPFCDEDLPFADAGKQTPCPSCGRIIKVPVPKVDKPKDWRDLAKKGPAAALVNLPDQLDDAWGTETKTKVSRGALEEAGVLVEKPPEPAGLGVWIKRGFYVLAIGGLLTWGFFAANRQRSAKQEKDAIAFAMTYVEPKAEGPAAPKSKLSPVQTAELQRGIGELWLPKEEGGRRNALDYLGKAREASKDTKETSDIDHDLLLADVCLSFVRLGGSEEEFVDGKRYHWQEEVQEEIIRTLDVMRTEEGKLHALRLIATRLLDKSQPEVALGVAGNQSNAAALRGSRGSLLSSQQVAILIAQDNLEMAKKVLKPPDLGKGVLDRATRLGYAEGYARKGDLDKARELAEARKGKAQGLDRLETALAVATIILAHPKTTDPAAEVMPFFEVAKAAYEDLKGTAPGWHTVQLIRLGARVGKQDVMKELAKKLDKKGDDPTRNRAYLEIILAELDRTQAPVPMELVDTLANDAKEDKQGNMLALAWSRLARHNARYGQATAVRERAETIRDDNLKPFILVGAALGEQDSKSP